MSVSEPASRAASRWADFPRDFLWGSATSAHQVEGGSVNNDWWAWEHTPGSGCVEPSGDAIDHWNRFDGDFALLAALGQNAHRISLEWSRIEPAPGEFSRAAIDHYRRVLESLARHELTAFVTYLGQLAKRTRTCGGVSFSTPIPTETPNTQGTGPAVNR